MRVILSEEARHDVNSIFKYISKDSIKYAIKTTNDIRLYMYRLKTSPYLGRYVPEIKDKKFRELIYKNYRIVYEIVEDKNIVYIHFVLHARRDLNSFYKSYIRNFDS